MISCLHYARVAFRRSHCRTVLAHARAASSKASSKTASSKAAASALLTPENELAERLLQTGLWVPRGGRRKVAVQTYDKHRVNIVSESLCDDIIEYMGPSLQRHRGCDLLDINPGAGLWSRKLHEAIQPRKHILMENDADLYAPFLSDLAAKDNVELVKSSGIIWSDLNQVLQNSLPDQKPRPRDAPPERNDSLLVTINIGTHPRKPYKGFECVSDLVLYQFMSAIRTGALFQKYGLVRMLIWVNDDRKRRILPRAISRRRRMAFEGELSCEWIQEIAGKDVEFEKRTELRDEMINKESGYRTLARMEAAGLKMPPGRETFAYTNLSDSKRAWTSQIAGARAPQLSRPFKQELEELEAGLDTDDTASSRLKILRWRERNQADNAQTYLSLLQQRDAARRISRTQHAAFRRANDAYNEALAALKKNMRGEYGLIVDNYHIFRQEPPAMFWDRRPFEPLAVRATEFFPNLECALLDLQPGEMHPVLRGCGEGGSSLSANMSQAMLRHWFQHGMAPVSEAMDRLWPGFSESADACPSLRQLRRGGNPLRGAGELSARCVNRRQWEEICVAMMESPFRPTYSQLVRRLMDEVDSPVEDEEGRPGALGASMNI